MRYASLNILLTLFRLTAPPICLEAIKPAEGCSAGKYKTVRFPCVYRFPLEKTARNTCLPFSLSLFGNVVRLPLFPDTQPSWCSTMKSHALLKRSASCVPCFFCVSAPTVHFLSSFGFGNHASFFVFFGSADKYVSYLISISNLRDKSISFLTDYQKYL